MSAISQSLLLFWLMNCHMIFGVLVLGSSEVEVSGIVKSLKLLYLPGADAQPVSHSAVCTHTQA